MILIESINIINKSQKKIELLIYHFLAQKLFELLLSFIIRILNIN